MKHHLALFSILLAGSVALDAPPSARILQQAFANQGTGTYSFSFESSDGTNRREEGHLDNPDTDDESLLVHGSYEYTDGDGRTFQVRYTADDNGFHPEGDHIKVPPFVPWTRKQIQQDNSQDGGQKLDVSYLPSSPKPPLNFLTTPKPPNLYIPSRPTTPRPPNRYVPSQPTPKPSYPIVPTTLKPPRPSTVQINAEEKRNEDEGYTSTPEPLKITLFNTVRPESEGRVPIVAQNQLGVAVNQLQANQEGGGEPQYQFGPSQEELLQLRQRQEQQNQLVNARLVQQSQLRNPDLAGLFGNGGFVTSTVAPFAVPQNQVVVQQPRFGPVESNFLLDLRQFTPEARRRLFEVLSASGDPQDVNNDLTKK